jgi:alkylation response protein AidB-like acyl-CoA dehydrogenase
MAFRVPLADIGFTLRNIAGFDPAAFGDVPLDAILGEAGRFAADVLTPLNRVGDREGVRLREGIVTTAPGWREAYRRFAEAGWTGVSAPEEYGGQGLPVMVEMAVQEMWNAGNAAFAVGPMLTVGAIEALAAHGSDELKAAYLPQLISGAWTATMNLTEPQAGSDLGLITTRATPSGDGAYLIAGQKIFITYGEHDLADNIVHLVLARLPNAPDGTGGISMFLVPKVLPGEDGRAGVRNRVTAAGVEHKLGLHGAPTCTMVYDEAAGFLVGEEHRGLACMFTMMNLARLSVGIQGVGVAERAWQGALGHARERRQGRAPGVAAGPSLIVEHPDVQMMLLRMASLVAASRALCYACAHAIDMGRRAPAEERAGWADRASLLTPLAKAYSTDAAIEVANLGIQVHGGAGYIEATGAAQHLRDARVFPIYEGTNGIQAIDLVARKLHLGEGAAVNAVTAELKRIVDDLQMSRRFELQEMHNPIATAAADLDAATAFMTEAYRGERRRAALFGASAYLRMFAMTAAGGLLAKGALAAEDDQAGSAAIAKAAFFAHTMLPEVSSLKAAVVGAAAALGAGAAGVLAGD